MTPEQFEQFMHSQRELYRLNRELLATNIKNLKAQLRIEKKLDRLIDSQPVKAPNYQKPLSEYQNFDWGSIGAKVIARDTDGVSEVEWLERTLYQKIAREQVYSSNLVLLIRRKEIWPTTV